MGGRISCTETVRRSCEHAFVRPTETKDAALRLVEAGLNDREIARRLDVPRTTVRDWRRPSYVPRERACCPRCGGALSGHRRRRRAAEWGDVPGQPGRSHVRRAGTDGGGVGLLVASQLRVSPARRRQEARTSDLPRALAARPRAAAPWALSRGLIRSGGCVFVNRTGRYECLSYEFANLFAEIIDLCEEPAGASVFAHGATRGRSGSTGARTWRCSWTTRASSRERRTVSCRTFCGCGGTGRRAAFRSP